MTLDSISNKIQFCPKCGEPTGKEIVIFDKKHLVPRMCKCRRAAVAEAERESKSMEKQIRLQQIFNNSLMTKEFKEMTFENWDHEVASENMFKLARKYAENFNDMKTKNIGLLIYGPPGNGKTYLSGCIANYLIKKFIPVVFISAIGVLDRIKDSFGKYGDNGVQSILNCFDNAELVIIDDLGTENNTAWSRATIYQIIDSRYRKKKPVIITTNLSKEQLKKRYDEDSNENIGRTYDRIANEMCTPIENTWSSIRISKGKEKTKFLGEILK